MLMPSLAKQQNWEPDLDAVDTALSDAMSDFARLRPKTAALQKRAENVMPGGNTRTVLFAVPFPIRIERAEGCVLRDVDGHSYVDFVGEYSAGIFGHSHPRIAEAVADAMAFGLNIGAQHVREIAFAEAVAKRFSLPRLRFTNSGTEANMMALAAARCFTGRAKIMPMKNGYHGGSLYFGNAPSPVTAPFEYVMGGFNDVAETQRLIAQNAQDLAAVILEPMLGGGGCIPATAEFLSMLRAQCTALGIILIFDEVMTSRLAPGGLSEVHGIQPDLKTLGKYIGGGMSFGCFGGRAEIMDLFDPSKPGALPHAGTFNNNTLTMTAGRVGLEEIFTPAACRALNQRGDQLRQRLNDVFTRYQSPMRATGFGSLLTIHPVAGEINSPTDLASADLRLKKLLYLHLLLHGIYIAERGYMALSLAIDDRACDLLVEAVEGFVLRHRGLLG
jgi:glutamate-1-semialdehyde 2,1-aminomutase